MNEKGVLSGGSSSKNLYFWGCSAKNFNPSLGSRVLLGGSLSKPCTFGWLTLQTLHFQGVQNRAFFETVHFWVLATENRALRSVSSLHFEVIYSRWLDSAEAFILWTLSMAPLMRLVEGRPGEIGLRRVSDFGRLYNS